MRRIRGSLFVAIFLVLIPAYTSAGTDAVSSVDQVLGALAEVVKDRAKEVATSAILDNLTSELCSGKTITVSFTPSSRSGDSKRALYLGDYQGCRQNNSCSSDVLFVKTCQLMNSETNLQLTDPYLLKTLSRDTVGFSIRLSTIKLNAEQFKKLNLDPFTDFVYAIMQQMVKGKTDLDLFSQETDKLVASYTENDNSYSQLVSEIVSTTSTTTLLDKVTGILSHEGKCDGEKFKELFDKGKTFNKALGSPCSAVFKKPDELQSCRVAQLACRVLPPLEKMTGTNPNEESRKLVRQISYMIYESDIYRDAYVANEFDDFASSVKSIVRGKVKNGWTTRTAMNDSLRLIASIAQALTYEHDEAIAWLKLFRQDVKKAAQEGTLQSYYNLRSSNSLDWFNEQTVPPYTQKMRANIKQMLVTPQFYLFRYEQKDDAVRRAFDTVQRISEVAALLTSDDNAKQSVGDMVRQVSMMIRQISEIMKTGDDTRDFSNALDSFAVILKHAQERDWVAVGFDISDQLNVRADNREIQRGLQFSRTLLSMYQAESKEDAKAILQSALENASSRKQRYDQWAFDITALAGMRAGKIKQEWANNLTGNNSRDDGYGLFVPFGIQIANNRFGTMIYPVDLGAYVSGSNADKTPDVRVQSALHSGVALYFRFSDRYPVVLGGSADYKPRFGNDDSAETRFSVFVALELPMYLIK